MRISPGVSIVFLLRFCCVSFKTAMLAILRRFYDDFKIKCSKKIGTNVSVIIMLNL